MEEFNLLLSNCCGAFKQARIADRARELAYGSITCLGRRTITGLLSSSGKQFQDWTAEYRLFGKSRVDVSRIFQTITSTSLKELGTDQMIVVHMDDTLLRKRGKKIYGAGWRRDPLGPPFHTNFIWGQRFIQLSMSLPEAEGPSRSSAIPVDFFHCPTAIKPGKKAEPPAWEKYKEEQKQLKLSIQGVNRLQNLRDTLDQNGAEDRELIACVDGSYTNGTVLKNLPNKITLIGRTRKDTKLYCIPKNQPITGRKRTYGEELPTPEEIRQSDKYHYQEVRAWAAGKIHNFDIKVVKGVRWRTAGGKHDLQLVVIRPLGYRLTKKSTTLYRKPAYLICTDPNLDIKKLLQAYLWRWEIEVNIRDEKTIMGCGEEQVRTPESVERVPAFKVAIYALLKLAAQRAMKDKGMPVLPKPKWYVTKPTQRITTSEMVNTFRMQLWTKSMFPSFSDFVNKQVEYKSQRNMVDPLISAISYCRK